MRKPNILLIMTDQQSANMMSCAGNTYVNTPNMDRIARKVFALKRHIVLTLFACRRASAC